MKPLSVPVLSERGIRILTALAQGQTDTNRYAMDISVHTVNNHLRRLCQQLEVRNRTHAVAMAIRQGCIRVD